MYYSLCFTFFLAFPFFTYLKSSPLISAYLAHRIQFKLDGAKFLGGSKRPWTALIGGILAGFGARVAAGCTSGLGLSGAAVLSLAGFTFLGTFFAVGLLVSRFLKEEK